MHRPTVPAWSAGTIARALVVAVFVVDLLVCGLVGHALRQSRAHHRDRAVVATRNLSAALEQYLGGLVDKIDLSLVAIVDEYERELASGGVDGAALDAYLARQRRRLLEVDAIRTVDARGDIDHGDDVRPGARANVADRAFFTRLRDETGAGLLVSEPVIGRLKGKPEIVFARRITRPDGSFAGVATAVVAVDGIGRTFSTLDLGRRGVVVLRDEQLGLVVRQAAEGTRIAIGDRTVSPELQRFVRERRTEATYAGVAVDGIERTFTFRRLARYPLFVIVGLAFDDYLGEWWQELAGALGFLVLFVVLTAVAASSAVRAWRRRDAAVRALASEEAQRRELEARMQEAERMASLGTLAAGVAHEVNNPLTYVLSNVGFAVEQLRATEAGWSARPEGASLREAAAALQEALSGAESVRHIVRDLKTFSRADGERVAPVDLNRVVEACLKMSASVTAGRARVVRRLGDVPLVLANEARLGQVVLNLVVNAAQAIPGGPAAAHEIAVSTARADGGRVVLEVRDTGTGIAPDVLPRIFDPFFTTKGVREGTGLGLSICHGIVKAFGGEIRVETAVGRGSAFRVLLPAVAGDFAGAGAASC
ncbi:ATP-binding protein [Anaeromyxobacter oryzae]|uniref:ATP-binding protein n=1 Tax=Anaeromyxobacter oryzae TaxID=2918170 RepID=UPI0020BF9DC4|nr:ATP-binding protein [Anaeromyxobacter oryzae]